MRRYLIIHVLTLLVFAPTQFLFAAETSLEHSLLNSVRENNLKLVIKLIEQGANPFFEDSEGRQAAEVAIDRGFFKIAHYLQAFQNQKEKIVPKLKAPLSINLKLSVNESIYIKAQSQDGYLPQLYTIMK